MSAIPVSHDKQNVRELAVGEGPPNTWAWFQRFAVRATLLYFLAYLATGQVGNDALPGALGFVKRINAPIYWLSNRITPWIGSHLFGVAELTGGGGDSLREWVRVFSFIALALILAGIWTAFRPHSRNPDRLHACLRAFMRYPLAFTMIKYGVMKFTRIQFGAEPMYQLMTPLGEFSPPALLWAFMTASFPYRVFTGVVEVMGGVLLLSRRTTTLGALLVLGAMINVLAMNYAYDVGVKLLAGHLVLMAIVLLTPELPRLLRVFVLNRPTAPLALPSPVASARLARVLVVASVAYAVYVAAVNTWADVTLSRTVHSGNQSPLMGIYDVESLSRNGRRIESATAVDRWNRVAVERTGLMTIQFRDGNSRSYLTWADSSGRELVLIRPRGNSDPRFDYRNYYVPLTNELIAAIPKSDSSRRFVLTLDWRGPERFSFRGQLEGDTVDVTLRRMDDSRLLLRNWGRHLIHRPGANGTWVVAPYSGWPMDSTTRAAR